MYSFSPHEYYILLSGAPLLSVTFVMLVSHRSSWSNGHHYIHNITICLSCFTTVGNDINQQRRISQDAQKFSGICSACHAVHQFHLKDGAVHLHGPCNNHCPGSYKPPLGVITITTTPQSISSAHLSQSHTILMPTSSSSCSTSSRHYCLFLQYIFSFPAR